MYQLDLPMPARQSGGLRSVRQLVTLALMCASVVFASAHAAEEVTEGPVKIVLTQSRVVVENGKEKIVDAPSVKPGDVLEYRAVYTNTSDKAVQDLEASLPVPEGLEYLARSAKSEPKYAVRAVSRDGLAGAEPLMRVENNKKVALPPSEYRFLRWQVGSLPAGRSVAVSLRARVTSAAPSVSPATPSGAASDTTPQR